MKIPCCFFLLTLSIPIAQLPLPSFLNFSLPLSTPFHCLSLSFNYKIPFWIPFLLALILPPLFTVLSSATSPSPHSLLRLILFSRLNSFKTQPQRYRLRILMPQYKALKEHGHVSVFNLGYCIKLESISRIHITGSQKVLYINVLKRCTAIPVGDMQYQNTKPQDYYYIIKLLVCLPGMVTL